MLTRFITAAAVFLTMGGTALAEEHHHGAAPEPVHPGWAKMKGLVGSWVGTSGEARTPSTTSFRVVSGGSALLNVLGEGTPHEMVTMFHMDLEDLLATHYCSAGNQPRMKAVPADAPNQVAFEFRDGTNIKPDDGHMQRVVFTFVDADHHTQDWTFRENGKDSTLKFEFHRK